MPNTKEKLIELLGQVQDKGSQQRGFGTFIFGNEKVADHLIANGVTFHPRDIHWATEQAYKNGKADAMKWIPVTERLPEKEQDVLCSRGNHIGALMDVYTYMGDDKWDDTYGNRSYTDDEGITHWMPLPQPPKGE